MFDKFLNVFEAGGPMMVPLLLTALVALVIFLERFLYLHKAQINAVDFVEGIKTSLKKQRLLEAITLCDETPCPVSRVIKAALVNHDQSREIIARALNTAALLELPLLQRRVSSLVVVAKIAPIMGLMGTVIALLETFRKMGFSGSYLSAAELSTQIYNALISTGVGLLLCMAAWVAYSFIQGRVRAIAYDIDWASNEILLFIERGMPAEEGLRVRGGGAK